MDPRLAVPRPLEEELQAEQRLAGSGPSLDHRRAPPRQPSAQHLVEPGDAGRRALVETVSGSSGAPSGPRTRGKNVEPVGADLEEVAARHDVGPAQLEDLDLADRPSAPAGGWTAG